MVTDTTNMVTDKAAMVTDMLAMVTDMVALVTDVVVPVTNQRFLLYCIPSSRTPVIDFASSFEWTSRFNGGLSCVAEFTDVGRKRLSVNYRLWIFLSVMDASFLHSCIKDCSTDISYAGKFVLTHHQLHNSVECGK